MKIAYAIHGYGRGHAMRSLAVLPSLKKNHEVLLFTGFEAYDSLRGDCDISRIPVLRFQHKKNGKISNIGNLKHNTGAVLDIWFRGPVIEMIKANLAEFGADLVISDSEAFTLSAARDMGLPTIMFDHYGLLVYCKLDMPPLDRLSLKYEKLWYKSFYGHTDRIIASGFFTGPQKRDGVKIVGPVIRDQVRTTEPSRKEHLLVYIAQGHHEFLPNIEEALLGIDCPVFVYGTDRRGMHKNITFKPISNQGFIDDLASCRAVLGSTGNQLCGEVIYFKKPMIGIPMDCLEQRLNVNQIVKLGIGMRAKRHKISAPMLREFLTREDEYVKNMPESSVDGGVQAAEALEHYIQELTAKKTRDSTISSV